MYSDREILYFLQTISGIGTKSIRELWRFFSTGEQLFGAEEKDLKLLLKPQQVRNFLQEREKDTPAERMADLVRQGIRYVSMFDWQYPIRLRSVTDAPLALFVRGELPPEESMSAAVVGARCHSRYGAEQTKAFSTLLARREIGIVSGMARGIDGIAQRTAIENGGRTYAVLGCGVDVCYPDENRKLYEQIPFSGGLISEYLPGTLPQAGLFPLRNRIISALGDILLVMEAREKSGTLITVDMALEQGKEIWALPGRVDDSLSTGCNRLIAQGAGILTDMDSFAGELSVLQEKYGMNKKMSRVIKNVPEEHEELATQKEVAEHASLEKEIISLLRYAPLSLEAIYDHICAAKPDSCSVQQLSVLLLELCMKKKLRQLNGGFFVTV